MTLFYGPSVDGDLCRVLAMTTGTFTFDPDVRTPLHPAHFLHVLVSLPTSGRGCAASDDHWSLLSEPKRKVPSTTSERRNTSLSSLQK